MIRHSVRMALVAAVVATVAGPLVPAAQADPLPIQGRKCPYGYYGVEVYDKYGNHILWACVRSPRADG